jgi:hypothetical protein
MTQIAQQSGMNRSGGRRMDRDERVRPAKGGTAMSHTEQRLSETVGNLYWTLHEIRETARQRGVEPLVSMCDDLKGRVWLIGLAARSVVDSLEGRTPRTGGRP